MVDWKRYFIAVCVASAGAILLLLKVRTPSGDSRGVVPSAPLPVVVVEVVPEEEPAASPAPDLKPLQDAPLPVGEKESLPEDEITLQHPAVQYVITPVPKIAAPRVVLPRKSNPVEESAAPPEEAVAKDVPNGFYGTGEVDVIPAPTRPISPEYPWRARRKGVSGSVILQFIVGADGVPREISVLSSSPSGFFEKSAVDAVSSTPFSPALRDGIGVPCRMQLEVRFSLESSN